MNDASSRTSSTRLACCTLALMGARLLQAQHPIGAAGARRTYGRVVRRRAALRVAPAREAYAIDRIGQPGAWRPAALGSLATTRGEGSPHRVLACGLDETSYVVSHITDDGYLRVHVAGARPRAPLWDSWHVGQRIIVLTTARATSARVRAVPGVFAVRSTHLWRRSPGAADPLPTLEDLWIDVGVRTRAEVSALG